MFLLVAYDIAEPKRLHQIARVMEDYGSRVQKSVFECRLGPGELAGMLIRVREIIKNSEDKVQVYNLCETCQKKLPPDALPDAAADVDVVIC